MNTIPGLLNMSELLDKADQDQILDNKALRKRNLAILSDDQMEITLNDTYPIDLEQITNSAELVDWFYHLAESKSWYSPQMFHDFMVLFRKAFRAHFGRSPRGLKSWNWKTKRVVS